MADRLDDAADLAVTELRRKARRRLVGAVVLALAAAILLPLLLESDPRPLGDAVSIQIPPVDNDKFVSRLSPAATKGKDAKSEVKPGASQAPSTSGATPGAGGAATSTPATTSPSTGKAAPPPPAAVAPAPAAAVSASPPVPANAPAVASGAAPAAESSSQSAPAASVAQAGPATTFPTPPPGASPPSAAQAAPAGSTEAAGMPAVAASPEIASTQSDARKPGSFVIQLAAFTDDKGANAFANRVRKEGFPAYTEPYRTKTGTVWRVRVGGYLTRAEANDALASLKSAGHKGLVSVVR